MSDDSWIRIIVFAVIAATAALIGKFKKPRHNTPKVVDEVVRLPKSTAIAGWVIGGLGVLSFLGAAVLANEATYPLVVLGILLTPLGITLIAYYRNWFLALLNEEIVVQTLAKKIIRIRYDAVTSAEVRRNGRAVMLRIRGNDGTKISADDRYVDSAAIIQRIQTVQRCYLLRQLPPPQGPSPYTRPNYGPFIPPTNDPYGLGPK